MSVDLIIFDLDGTLIDSIGDITNALNHALESCGVAPLDPARVKDMVGEGPSKLVQDVIEFCDLDADRREGLVRSFLCYYASHPAEDTSVYPYVRSTLEALRDRKKAIVTNKTGDITARILDRLDLTKYFDMVVGVDTIAEKKPSPVPVYHVLSALGIMPEGALLVGDSVVDMETGRAASVKTVAVTYGYGRAGFQTAGDYVIDSMGDLMGVIGDLEG